MRNLFDYDLEQGAVPEQEDAEPNDRVTIMGTGGCRSCSCRGYRPNTPPNHYCKDCGHHWNNHA